MRQILPIKDTYVSHWGLWEAVREIIQNAKDEEDQRGHRMVVSHTGSTLVVTNEGADMDRKVLLLGYTSKEGSGLRGHFGEGLNLALLAATRAGFDLSVSTQNERWVPSIEESRAYGHERVLVISSTKHASPRTGVTIKIKCPAETWAEFKPRFLFLNDVEAVATQSGSVLVDPAYKGKCFVKGIYTCDHPETHYGYDFANVRIDRDRRMIDTWDLEWSMSTMLRECLGKAPEKFVKVVFDLLEAGSNEVRSLKHTADGAALDALMAEFQARNGEGALPVRTMAESREIEHFGRKTAVVGNAVADILEKKVGSFQTIQAELKKAVRRSFSWADLSENEREAYTSVNALLLSAGVCEAEPNVQIVEFNDEALLGLAHQGSGMIQVARKQLADSCEYLATMIHEVAHISTGASDGEHAHIRAIEVAWIKVYRQAA